MKFQRVPRVRSLGYELRFCFPGRGPFIPMWGTSLGVGLGSGSCLAPHQVVNGTERVVGVQQCGAELGHPITGLAVAIETDANARAARRREGGEIRMGPGTVMGGRPPSSSYTQPWLCPNPIGPAHRGKRMSPAWPPPVSTVTGRPHSPVRDVIVMLMWVEWRRWGGQI